METQRVIVLFGGASSERLVSTASAQNILQTLPRAEAWFLAKDGAVYPCGREGVLAHRNPFKEEFPVEGAGKPLFNRFEDALTSNTLKQPAVVLALHGKGVEDGTLQSLMENASVAFTGSGSKASALAFDKLAAKKVAIENSVRTARYQEITSTDPKALSQSLWAMIRQYERVAVKPVADGSSCGLHILYGRSDVDAVASKIAREGRAYLVEEFLVGTELTVGVVDHGKKAHALCPSEVRLDEESNFDYDAKYLGKGVEELTPARVSPEVTRAARELAVKMHRALGCEGYSRTDLIVTRDGPVFLETNTLPGMSQASFFPQQLVASGSSMREFFETEIRRIRDQYMLDE